jgi:hypothetical protein
MTFNYKPKQLHILIGDEGNPTAFIMYPDTKPNDIGLSMADHKQMLNEWSDADIEAHLKSESASDRFQARLLIALGYNYVEPT